MAFDYNKYKSAVTGSPLPAKKLSKAWKGVKTAGKFAGKMLGWPAHALEAGLFAVDWAKMGREKAWDKHKYWGSKEGDLADYYPRNLPRISPWHDEKVLKDYYKENPHKR